MSAARVHVYIDQGTDFSTTINLADEHDDPLDLSPYTASGQIRKHWSSANSINLEVDLQPEGVVSVSLAANTTATMTPGRYMYDVVFEETETGRLMRVVRGYVTVVPGVTR